MRVPPGVVVERLEIIGDRTPAALPVTTVPTPTQTRSPSPRAVSWRQKRDRVACRTPPLPDVVKSIDASGRDRKRCLGCWATFCARQDGRGRSKRGSPSGIDGPSRSHPRYLLDLVRREVGYKLECAGFVGLDHARSDQRLLQVHVAGGLSFRADHESKHPPNERLRGCSAGVASGSQPVNTVTPRPAPFCGWPPNPRGLAPEGGPRGASAAGEVRA
jgi:hypothetical protein